MARPCSKESFELATALLEYLDQAIPANDEKFSQQEWDACLSSLLSTVWIPVRSSRGDGDDDERPSDVVSSGNLHLVDESRVSVYHGKKLKNENVVSALRWTYPPLEKILDHLDALQRSWHKNQLPQENLLEKTTTIYKHLSSRLKQLQQQHPPPYNPHFSRDSSESWAKLIKSRIRVIYLDDAHGFVPLDEVFFEVEDVLRDSFGGDQYAKLRPFLFRMPRNPSCDTLFAALEVTQHLKIDRLAECIRNVAAQLDNNDHNKLEAQQRRREKETEKTAGHLRTACMILNAVVSVPNLSQQLLAKCKESVPLRYSRSSSSSTSTADSQPTLFAHASRVVFFESLRAGVPESESELCVLHDDVRLSWAQKLGCRATTEVFRNKYSQALASTRGCAFGQRESLAKRIRQLLIKYPCDSLLLEALQNADDAGATTFQVILDKRQQGRIPLFAKKVGNGENQSQQRVNVFSHPALCLCNNARFTDQDFAHLQDFGGDGSWKKKERDLIGRFGLGFLSVYNFTDVPMIKSGDSIALLDSIDTSPAPPLTFPEESSMHRRLFLRTHRRRKRTLSLSLGRESSPHPFQRQPRRRRDVRTEHCNSTSPSIESGRSRTEVLSCRHANDDGDSSTTSAK